MAYTRAELRAEILQRLGWSATDTFVSTAQLNQWIADSARELHALLSTVHKPGTWGVDGVVITTTAGTELYALPSNYGRMISVRLKYGEELVQIEPFSFADAWMTTSTATRSWTPGAVRYRVDQTNGFIDFTPVPAAAYDVYVYFEQAPPDFGADGDQSWMGEDEYLVLDVMIKCLSAEEADVSDRSAQKLALEERIKRHATPIDIGRPAFISDARGEREGASGELAWWRR